VLKQAGIRQDEVDWFELNEAFAAQALAVMRTLDLDPAKVNPLGGRHRPRPSHWARPAPSARRRWCMACSAPGSATAW
jgi:hypothetical protein